MRGEVRGEAERARLLSEYEASGLSLKGFAEREGVAVSTFYEWRRTARRARNLPVMARVIRRRPVEHAPRRSAPAMIVEVGGARVALDIGFDAQALERLLGVLEARRWERQ
jgi:transposase-like protein